MSSEGTSPRSPSIRGSFSVGNEIPMELSSERVKAIRKDYITRHKEVSSILFGIENSPMSNQQPFIQSVSPVKNKSKIQSQRIPSTPTSDKLRPEGLCREAGPISPSNQKNFLSSFWDSIVDSVSSPIAIFQSTDPDSTEKDDQSTDKGLDGYRDAVEEEFEDDLSSIATIEVYSSESDGKDINEFERMALQTERRFTDSGSNTSLDDGDHDFFNSMSGPEEMKAPTVRAGGGRSKIPPADSMSPICLKAISNNGTSILGETYQSVDKVVSVKSNSVVKREVTMDEAVPIKIKTIESCEPPVPVPVRGLVSSMIRTMEGNIHSTSANLNTKSNFDAASSGKTILVTDSKSTRAPAPVPLPAVSTISNIYSAETVEKVTKKKKSRIHERHSEEGLKAVEITSPSALDVSSHLDTPSLLVELRAWRDIELEADESFIRGLRQTRKDLEDRLELIRLKDE